MSDVSKMKNTSTGEVQDIKDATAREQIEELNETLTELNKSFSGFSLTRSTIATNGTRTITYVNDLILFVFRGANNVGGLYIFDQWSRVIALVEANNISVSVEDKVASITNNSAGNVICIYLSYSAE